MDTGASSFGSIISDQLAVTLHSAVGVAFPPADAVAIAIGSKNVSGYVATSGIVVLLFLGFLVVLLLSHLDEV